MARSLTKPQHKAMTPDRIAELRDTYREGLLADTIPFWLRHAPIANTAESSPASIATAR